MGDLQRISKFQIHTVLLIKDTAVFFTKPNINPAFIRMRRSFEGRIFDKLLAKNAAFFRWQCL